MKLDVTEYQDNNKKNNSAPQHQNLYGKSKSRKITNDDDLKIHYEIEECILISKQYV